MHLRGLISGPATAGDNPQNGRVSAALDSVLHANGGGRPGASGEGSSQGPLPLLGGEGQLQNWTGLAVRRAVPPENSLVYQNNKLQRESRGGGGGSRWVLRGVAKSNHLEERLLDQAQARASYTPLFGGHSRSIPQGMILDVQPLVKSLFCPIRQSPNGFFDFEASIP